MNGQAGTAVVALLPAPAPAVTSWFSAKFQRIYMLVKNVDFLPLGAAGLKQNMRSRRQGHA